MPRDTLQHCYVVLDSAGYFHERVDVMQRHGRRKDFGGFGDILAWHPDLSGVLAIQSCCEQHMNPHKEKLSLTSQLYNWLSEDRRLELWVWAKRKRRGRDKRVLRPFIVKESRNDLEFEEGTEIPTWIWKDT